MRALCKNEVRHTHTHAHTHTHTHTPQDGIVIYGEYVVSRLRAMAEESRKLKRKRKA